MTSGAAQLSAIPPRQRRRMALVVGLFAALLALIGVVTLTGDHLAGAAVIATVALVAAGLLALVAWGLARSASLDESEAHLDAAVEATVRAAGGQFCDCGVIHDPGELHITDAECEHDGSGAACSHDCQTCVLAALRTT